MKKIILIIIVIVCCMSTFAIMPNSPEKNSSVLPKKVLDYIEKSDSISWILLDPNAPDSLNNSYARIGECLIQVEDTCEERVNALKSTLIYSKSFEDKGVSKECTFLPDVACVFYSGNQSLTFAYSFYCDVCRFEYEDTYKEYDGEYVRDAIMQIALEIFPKDRYLRKIAGKTR